MLKDPIFLRFCMTSGDAVSVLRRSSLMLETKAAKRLDFRVNEIDCKLSKDSSPFIALAEFRLRTSCWAGFDSAPKSSPAVEMVPAQQVSAESEVKDAASSLESLEILPQ